MCESSHGSQSISKAHSFQFKFHSVQYHLKIKAHSTLKMKCHSFVILILFATIYQCKSNEIRCQKFTENSESLEIYCQKFSEKLPEKCLENLETIPYSQNVTLLKIGGCNFDLVMDIIATYNDTIRILDISQSGYLNLEWMSMILPLNQLEFLNVSHNQFEHIPMEFLPNTPQLTGIDLSYNRLSRIDQNNQMKGAKNLKKVILSHNKITEIHSDTFKESPNLVHIDLSYNHFDFIPTFPPNKLLSLHLEENTILDFDCTWIAKQNATSVYLPWTFLYTFDIEQTCRQRRINVIVNGERDGILIKPNGKIELHCRERSFVHLRVFQAAAHAFDNIAEIIQCFGNSTEVLILSNNIIGKLDPIVFDRFELLQRLKLRDTMLTEFDITRYRNRQRLLGLDLSQNNLKRLDKISLLLNLQDLDVAENLIENIPEIIADLPMSLTYLDVSGNFLGPVNRTTFDWLIKLQSLQLSHTALSFIDFNPFEKLNDLLFLDISRNNLNISNFDLLDETLRKLITFNASHCHINGGAKVARKLFPQLEKLDLAGNAWGEIHTNFLDRFINLEVLNLSDTNLLSFDPKLFGNLNKLVHLDLSFNRLRSIDLELLSARMEWLNLEENDLEKIEHFAPAQKLTLGISRNQLMCTDVKRFKHDLKHVTLFGDPSDQKHQQDCTSSKQSISDFLSTVYDKVTFW